MKIVVLDDDPTGSQTLHGCLLMLSWDVELLREGLRHPSPIFFVLANTRSLLPEDASLRIREICSALRLAVEREGLKLENIHLVSRGDSTLRGHGFLEPFVISKELGPFSATFHIPAFLEGGRTTVEGIHYLNGIPVHKTSFAQDRLFGYNTSQLELWLEEKSKGFINHHEVKRISVSQLNAAKDDSYEFNSLLFWIESLEDNQHIVVDAEIDAHLKVFVDLISNLSSKKRFLFRSAASLLNSLARVKPRILPREDLRALIVNDLEGNKLPGIVSVGSHVHLADLQLKYLLANPKFEGVEIEVSKLNEIINDTKKDKLLASFQDNLRNKLLEILERSKIPVLFTSRGEVRLATQKMRLVLGLEIAEITASVIGSLTTKLGYIISKGGITTQVLLSHGIASKYVFLKGQILPGLSLVIPSSSSSNLHLPIVTFPGNLGKEDTLLEALKIIESC